MTQRELAIRQFFAPHFPVMPFYLTEFGTCNCGCDDCIGGLNCYRVSTFDLGPVAHPMHIWIGMN